MIQRRLRFVVAWLPLTLIVVIGAALSIGASIGTARWEAAQAQAEFERQAGGEIDALKVSINASSGAVTALGALYEARGPVTKSEFERFAATIRAGDPSIQALGWAQVVPHDQRAEVERQLAEEYGASVHITQLNDDRSRGVAGERDRYVPVIYVTPLPTNAAALAFDVTSEATRRAAVEQAERTGQPAASGRIVRLQNASDYNFLLFRPMFAVGEPRRMTGLVFGLFRIRDIAAAAMAGSEGSHVRLWLLDRSAPPAEQVLYSPDPDGRPAEIPVAPSVTSDVSVGGRWWRIVALPSERDGSTGLKTSDLALAGGLLLTGNLALYVLLGVRHRLAIEREHQQLNAALGHSRERLALATKSARIGIWDWDITADRLVWDARMYELYGIREQDFSGAYDAWQKGLHPDDRAAGDAAIRAAIEGVKDFNIEFRVLWPNGEVHDIEAHALVQSAGNGRATRMIGVNWDITERKRATETIRRQADQYATMLATTSDGFWLLDRNGNYLAANEAYCTMTGYSREELLALTIRDIEAAESAEETRRHMATIMSAGFDRFESRHRRRDGTTIDIEGSVSYWQETGQFLCFARDITDRKRAETALQASETRYRDLFESTRDGILVLDPTSGTCLSANSSTLKIFGATNAQAFLDCKVWEFSPERQPDGRLSAEKAWEMIATAEREGTHFFEWVHARADGTPFPADVLLTRVTRGPQTLLYATIRDITERKRADGQIAHFAHYDNLTGLANRRVFVDALEQRIARSHRDATSFAVLYLDLDHFKDVNDALGHPVGDVLLRTTGERLLASVRESDTVARFGGDEFAILLSDIAEPANAAAVSDRIFDVLSEPAILRTDVATVAADITEKIVRSLSEAVTIGASRIHTGATVGIAVYGPDSLDAETMLSHADLALYRAKAEQRGTYRFFSDGMDAEVRARVRMGTELREAIASRQFLLMYQPQVDMHTGRILGLEALVRWQHPTLGIVGPGKFIPEAERNGLIVPLGRWIMGEACRQARQWLDAGIAPPLVAVNLSGIQFKMPLELEKDIAAVVAESGIPPQLLELELTESVLMEASRDHNEVLLRLRKQGHRIAVDDFGSGYSSLDYLRRYPVDRLKIAQTFIADIGTVAGNDAIVRAALSLAHELNIEVVVEGVETLAQLELLKTWGGRIVQGYCFAKPLPVAEATALLRIGEIPLALHDTVTACTS